MCLNTNEDALLAAGDITHSIQQPYVEKSHLSCQQRIFRTTALVSCAVEKMPCSPGWGWGWGGQLEKAQLHTLHCSQLLCLYVSSETISCRRASVPAGRPLCVSRRTCRCPRQCNSHQGVAPGSRRKLGKLRRCRPCTPCKLHRRLSATGSCCNHIAHTTHRSGRILGPLRNRPNFRKRT